LSPTWRSAWWGRAIVALLLVLFVGRGCCDPCRRDRRHRSNETFTLTVLFVALGSAWRRTRSDSRWRWAASWPAMLLSETEFRHQTERDQAVPGHPARPVFVSVGMLLDLRLLLGRCPGAAALPRCW